MKLKKTIAMVMLAALGTMSLVGCEQGNKQVVNQGNTTNTSSVQETPKLSGKLVVYSAGPDDLSTNIQKGFEKKTGVKIELFQGTNGKILSRLEAEKEKPVADVLVLASLSSAQGLMKNGQTLSYKEAKNGDKLFDKWAEKDGNYFNYSLSALGIAYNTKLVKTPPKSWGDLGKDEWKDKVNIPDPAQSGSAADFAAGYVSANGDKGWDLFKQYKSNGVLMAGANQEALDPVITGAKSVVAAGVDYMTYQAKAKGETVDLVYPSEGTIISARPALILKSSANVENAKAFIDYLLSDEAQKMVTDAYLLPGRKDVKPQGRPSASEIPELKADAKWMSDNQKNVISKFTEIFKN